MKTVAVALVMMLAGVIATPYQVQNAGVKDKRVLDEIINGIIDSVIEQLEALDPYVVEYASGEYTFPLVSGVFSAEAYVKNFQASGFSGIVNNGISFADNTISFDLGLPDVEATVDEAVANVAILNRNIQGEIRGRLAIKGVRLAGQVNLNGFDIVLDLGLEGIESELEVIILGRDISATVNNFLSQTLPATLKEYKEQLDRQIAILIQRLIDRLT